jgi:TolB-like protein
LLDDREIRVTPRSLAVLYMLARRSREVVTKLELFEAIWPDAVVTDAALSSCIRELRRTLGDDARDPRFIETVHRRGFRFLPPSVNAEPSRSRSFLAASDEDGPLADTALIEGLSGADPTAPTSRAQPAIVVLPFENIASDESGRVIARGLVHDIITRIARSRAMLIIARGTAFQFVRGPYDVGAIGRKLGVRYVVQGAVQTSGSGLKVSVALASALDRQELWSEQYDRKLDDFMLIQQEIAEQIVCALESAVHREEVRRSVLMPSTDLDAWNAYHRGIDHMYRFTLADCEQAEQLFLRSIEMEPTVPRPYAALSFINFERAFLNLDGNRASSVQKAFDQAQQSLSIDPLDPMGHWALSRAQLLRAELEASKHSLETAIELNPSYAIAQYSLGWIGLQLGEHELCLDRVDFARRLSPYDPLKFAMLVVSGLSLALMGRTAEAMQLAVQSMQQPNIHHHVWVFSAVIYALGGKLDEARTCFTRARSVVPNYGLEDFLAAFPFRLERDLHRVSKAFELMQPRVHPPPRL